MQSTQGRDSFCVPRPGRDLDDYNALGGVRSALSRRAEQLYESLGADQQQVATQILLRMVRVGHGVGDVSRRVPMSELAQLDVDPVSLSDVLEKFIRYRLLSVGSEPVTSGATIGMAHEALLEEWHRLSAWVEQHRLALRRYDGLRAATTAWEDSGRHTDYLITGTRLAEARKWNTTTAIPLSAGEREFIRASVARHQAEAEAESDRRVVQRRLERRARGRLVGLAAAVVVVIVLTIIGIVGLDGPRSPRVTLFYNDSGEVSDLIEAGFDRAVSDHGFISQEIDVIPPGDNMLLDDAAIDQQLVIDWTLETDVDSVARAHPDTRFIVLDQVATAPNVTSIAFAVNEGSYLAGAAAALRSTTGVVGFIGGVDIDPIWQFEAGFVAGARAIDPDIRILTTYLAEPPDYPQGFLDPAAGERAAAQMYRAGADVIFAAAGTSGLGVFEAAVDLSEPGRHLWAIGVDSDQYVTVGDRVGTVAAEAWGEHILTSVVKRYDTAIYEALTTYADDGTTETVLLGLAQHGIDLSYSGGFLDDVRDELEALRDDIVSGVVEVPCRPPHHQDIDDPTSTCPHS